MRLITPLGVEKLQTALHVKAKESPGFRFYMLYDKVYRRDVLSFAYALCYANRGQPGTDGQTFQDIASYGTDRWLDELAEDLRKETYEPAPVRRVWIPKSNGGRRPLGIPTIRDRVVQTAAVLVLEPIFEADLQPEQYAYRRGKNALDAVNHVRQLLVSGHTDVIDADLSGYFDTIPHSDLLKSLARRISDRHMLHLLKMWLVAPTEETDARGHRTRTTRNRDEKRGTPQGSPVSPLLSNIYMRRFILAWKSQGHEQRLDAHIVNYADDFVICCRGTADKAMSAMRRIMSVLKLTVNETKTRRCRVPEESFDFLGYTLGRLYSRRTGRTYLGPCPSKKKIQSLCREISDCTSRRWVQADVHDRIALLNRKMRGWASYFRLGPVSKAYRAIDEHARSRLRQWLRAKQNVSGRVEARFPDKHLHGDLGLLQLAQLTRSLPWANT